MDDEMTEQLLKHLTDMTAFHEKALLALADAGKELERLKAERDDLARKLDDALVERAYQRDKRVEWTKACLEARADLTKAADATSQFLTLARMEVRVRCLDAVRAAGAGEACVQALEALDVEGKR